MCEGEVEDMTSNVTYNNLLSRFSLTDLLEAVTAILLILNCNAVYGRLSDTNLYIGEITAVFVILLFLNSVKKNGFVKKKIFLVVLAIVFLSALYLVVRFSVSDKRNLVLQFLIFLPCMIFYLSKKGSKERCFDIYNKFSSCVFIISTLSTVVWIFAEIIPVLTANTSATIAWGTIHTVNGFYGLFFETQIENTFGFYLYKNTGIFCEAPMHSLVLILALIYELFLNKKPPKIKIMLLIVYTITTFSLTGVLCIIIVLLLKYWENIQKKRRVIRVLYTFVFLFMVLIAFFITDAAMGVKNGTGSYSIRMIDYIAGIRAWMDHFLFGVGYNSLVGLYGYKADLMVSAGILDTGQGFSNSLAAILGQGGLCLSMIYLLPFIIVLVGKRKKIGMNFKCWAIMILFLFTTTIFHARFIMFYFLAVAYILAFDSNQDIQEDRRVNIVSDLLS